MTRRRGCLRWVLVAYLVLLAASHGVRRLEPPAPPSLAALSTIEVSAATGTKLLPSKVLVAYREWAPPGAGPETPVLVLLHGSPGSSRDFLNLGPELAARFRVVAPDLPGFGASSHDVPDYSIRAHAAYTGELMAALGIDRAHVLGFSMGGGVALELADQRPRQVASVTMLSAIGVQELELLGDYRVNHALHGAQLAGLWLMFEAVPHFGLFDGGMLSREYARNFFDSDQRPLRQILGRLQVPMLILHGQGDILVPVEAARESYRLVPQSELVLFDESHFMVFAGSERLSRPITEFVERVERGEEPTRAMASPERLAAAAQPFDTHGVPRAAGVTLLVLAALLAFATLVSEDLTCIAAGVLVAHGRLSFVAATLACFAGIVVGDLALYGIGRLLGRAGLQRAPLKWWIKPEAVERGARWLEEKGPVIVFATRFLPGTRLATYVGAGLVRAGFWRFAGWFTLAALVWTPILVGFATWAGARALEQLELFRGRALGGLLLLAVGLYLLIKLALPLATWRGRRRLYGALQRKLRWEFWPPWMFYPPVVAYVLWLGLKHRSPTLFTAANPGMPASGFIGESKGAILDHLEPRSVARYARLPAAASLVERLAGAHAFMAAQGLDFPVVVKPDAGQRGLGVLVARSEAELAAALAAIPLDCVVQEHVGGVELGVFYVRLPGQEKGSVFSTTRKLLPSVVGDGERTVEELILADDRAVCAADAYLAGLGTRAEEVPRAGEAVRLTDLGTHCRGAVFLEGRDLVTPRLEAAIDRISRSFDGFYFGRFDLRVPSEEAARQGEQILRAGAQRGHLGGDPHLRSRQQRAGRLAHALQAVAARLRDRAPEPRAGRRARIAPGARAAADRLPAPPGQGAEVGA